MSALSEFCKNTENVTYDILTLDEDGKGFQYSSGNNWDWDAANEVKTRMESAEWNQDKTLHLVKRTRTETFEMV